jgi:preprotein translocase SecF subunit
MKTMFNLVQKRRWYFLLSALIIIPGLAIMIYSTIQTGAPFRLSIDFEGGSIYDLTFIGGDVTEGAIREVFASVGDENVIIQQLGQGGLRFALENPQVAEDAERATIVADLAGAVGAAGLGDDPVVSYDEEASAYTVAFETRDVTEEQVRSALSDFIGEETVLTSAETTSWSIRASAAENPEEGNAEGAQLSDRATLVLNELETLAPIDADSRRVESVSATIGQEVTRAAIFAVLTAAFVITSFIVIAFRQVPNAFRYGVCAIAAMVHDVLIVMGLMSLLGLLLGWEIDALFLTAVLTVVGFSVQDSIVVFDRIRENIPLRLGEPYETIVNRSLWETIHRSLATQLNAFFIMIAILLFGGETVTQFIFILFIGLLSGSYSSLFTAVPLLVAWEKGEIPFVNQNPAYQEA